MERRSFLARLLAALPALPFLPRALSAAVILPPAVRRSDKGIPRQMDIRHEIHPLSFDIEVYRHGKKTLRAVAYDLDADTVTELVGQKSDRSGFTYRTLSGGVTVKWIRP